MPEHDLRQLRVKQLLAQDPEINDTQMKDFRMTLNQSIESLEEKSKRTRRHILAALAVFLPGMVICNFLAAAWQNAAPNATAALVRGAIYVPFLIAMLAAALTGIWLVALYVFKYAPRINRARFDAQTSMMLELQQQVKQLHEDLERREE